MVSLPESRATLTTYGGTSTRTLRAAGSTRSLLPPSALFSARDGTAQRGHNWVESPSVTNFDVTTYGAVGDGSNDDRAAIMAAIDAAGEAAASDGEQKTVFLPAGEYKIVAPGTVHINVYFNVSGSWSLLGEDVSDSTAGIFHIYDSDPDTDTGLEGQRYINRTQNLVYIKTEGQWADESSLIEGSGTLWTAGYEDPVDGTGSTGQYYIQYVMDTDPAIILSQSHNNVTIRGAGSGQTKITYRCWGDIAPDDYEVDVNGDIVRTAIPPIEPTAQGQVRTSRTFTIYFKSDGSHSTGTNISGIRIEDIEFYGGCPDNGQGERYETFALAIDQWDEQHKGIALGFDHDGDFDGIEITGCKLTSYKGEILYSGGSRDKEVSITNCEIAISNSSAISIGGQVTIDGCTIHDVVNGTENYNDGGQFTVITNTDIYDSEYGVVWLGADATAYLTITGCNIQGGLVNGEAAVFISEFGQNVTIQNTTLKDSYAGVYLYYLNQGYGVVPNFSNLTLDTVTFEADTANMAYGIYAGNEDNIAAGNWQITDCVISEPNSYNVQTFLNDKLQDLSTHQVAVSNMDLSNTKPWRSASKGVAPTWVNCTVPAIVTQAAGTGDQTKYLGHPEYNIIVAQENNQRFFFTFNVGNLPDGYTATITYSDVLNYGHNIVIPANSDNTWSDQTLTPGDSLHIVYNGTTGKLDLQ